MTFTEIRNTVISRMTAQTIIDGKDVLYPNAPTFDPSGKLIWARLSNIPGQAGVNEIGAGPIVYRTGIIIIQLFVPQVLVQNSLLRQPINCGDCLSFRMTIVSVTRLFPQ
ncbi:phage protein [Escherichia coli]|uniref:Phage protein n=1 Tax=Escherichia coli TaxID=562 RepID=A0A377K947_ECOLX|nr:phage protein [Escherichia coli]